MPSSNPAQGPKQSHRGRKRSLCIYSDLHEGSIQVETMVPSKSLPLAALALFLFSISLSAAAGGDRIPAVVEALSDSGYAAMSLTIHLIADSITNFTSTFTIFTPPDSAFEAFGQPSLPHLLLHFAPISLSSTSLRSLPYGSEIPTLTSSSPLYVTTSRPDGSTVSINGVNISGSPIFDDGSVLVFPIDDFFRPNFSLQIAGEPSSCSNPRPRCKLQPFSQLQDASAALKSRGYLIMASFLDLQISGFLNPSPLKLTVFAPVDEALVMYSGDVLMYQSLFMRHILPCVLPWAELSELGKGAGTVFKDNGNGFTINIASDNGLVFVNRVKISFPDMFTNDWIVIHGLHDMIDLPEETNMGREDSAMGSESKIQESISPDRSEF